MISFMNDDFLLKTETARHLYHDIGAKLPIIDYHCHVSPKEIFEDHHFENITEVWLGGDHYKWRLMRWGGVDEHYITGDTPAREKFQKFAEVLPMAIGNPLCHWCHLELQRYFGYHGILNGETAGQVWALTEDVLSRPDMGVRGLIQKSHVAMIGTTDDPIDDLQWHKKLSSDSTFEPLVAPSFRPDQALRLDRPGWREYITKLETATGLPITDLDSLKAALGNRIAYFAENGCRASDHGLDQFQFSLATDREVDRILKAALAGKPVLPEAAEKVNTALLLFCAAEYKNRDIVMQLHCNCLRNPNTKAFALLGADSGFDCIRPGSSSLGIASLLDALHRQDNLPRTILYSLDSGDNAFLATLAGSFQDPQIPGKIQHGSAWWFHDNQQGIREQLISLGNLGLLGSFVGMLTDSRSFLSYTRHEYFRRILCDLIGTWVETGEYPNEEQALQKIVSGICYENAKRYFRL